MKIVNALNLLVSLWLLALAIDSTVCDLIKNDLAKENDVSDKKARLISFNNNEGEIKVELDFAIPFMKIPVGRKADPGNMMKSNVDVNTRGFLTVGVIMFLFITIVPKIVTLFIPQAYATTSETFLPLMSKLDETLRKMDISSGDCYQKTVCWIGSNTQESSPFSEQSVRWLDSLIGNDSARQAFVHGSNHSDCSIFRCPISFTTLANMLKLGKTFLS
ncbi:uncharacterized protein isoform X2 [Rhodnius prolixus]|uniref:uncharacterized protein isoform X2 n=1 Tax=Rhodnius prolixus TaxID=13249 RepID=UPI003D18EB66